MTATIPQQGPPTQGGPTLVRLSFVYGAPILDPADGTVHIDYVGETGRAVKVREKEHRGEGRNPDDEQPWSDRIVGDFITLEQGYWTDAERKARELWWIRNQGGLLPHRPRYNWRGNEDCPGQIPKWVAVEQRAARDHARGVVSRWTHPALFPPRPVLPRPVASRSVLRRLAGTAPARWLWRRVGPWLAVYSVLWLLLVVCAGMPAGQDTAGAALACTGATYAAWRKATQPKKRRTGRANRRRTR